MNAYLNKSGEARASLTFHVSEIKLFGSNGQSAASQAPKAQKAEPKERENVPMEQAVAQDSAIKPSTSFDDVPSVEDDLPF